MGATAFSVPCFLDRRKANGTIIPGIFQLPTLEARYGAGSFDDGNEATRWRGTFASGCRLASTMQELITALQVETDNPSDGVLGTAAEAFGSCGGKIQKAITSQRENNRFDSLDETFMALPGDDARRRAWLSTSRLSRVWINARPSLTESLLRLLRIISDFPAQYSVVLSDRRSGNLEFAVPHYVTIRTVMRRTSVIITLPNR